MKAHLLKTLCLTFSLLLTHSLLDAATSASGPYGGPILKSNWQNGMSYGPESFGENCIYLESPPHLSVILTVHFAQSNINPLGPFYLGFQFGAAADMEYVTITENNLQATVIDNETFYVFTHSLSFDMTAYCASSGPDPSAFSVTYGLYMGGSLGSYVSVPAHLYPNLFPTSYYSDFDNGPLFNVEYSGVKQLCCNKPVGPDSDDGGNAGIEAETISIPALSGTKTGISEEDVQVFPNPFNDQIQLNLDGNAVMFRELLITDWTGRVVFYRENTNPVKTETFNLEIDTQTLPNGVYWLHIKTDVETKNIPLVKS